MFKIEFSTSNAVFASEPDDECARILCAVAKRVEAGFSNGPVVDVNGNRIGYWSLDLSDQAEG